MKLKRFVRPPYFVDGGLNEDGSTTGKLILEQLKSARQIKTGE